MQVKKDFFQTGDGARLYYEEAGEGRPLVLFHGYKCSSRFFERLIQNFGKHYHVLAMDFRGHGNSSKVLQGHTIERYSEDIREFLTYKNIQNGCLLGWSMGGSAVLRYHQKYGGLRISGIVLVDCTLSPYSSYPWNKHGLNNQNSDLTQKIVIQCDSDHQGYCDGFAEKIWNLKASPEQKEWVKQELLKTPSSISMAIYTDFAHTDGAAMLKQACLPILFYGADSVVSPNGRECAQTFYPEFMPRDVPRESCLIENGTHIPFITNSAVFDGALEAFLRKYK